MIPPPSGPPFAAPRIDAAVRYVLTSAQGLLSNQVHRITQGPSLRLYLATPTGLARFDGSLTRTWSRDQGLRCNGLRCVAVGEDETVWLGSDLGLELLTTENQTRDALSEQAWTYGLCQHVDLHAATPWVGCAQGLLQLQGVAGQNTYRVIYYADVGFVNQVLCLSEQRVLAASTSHGLVESDGQRWWRYPCAALADRVIVRMAQIGPGLLLLGTDAGAWVIDDAKREVMHQLLPCSAPAGVTALCAGSKGVWVAFGRTLLSYSLDSGNPQLLESHQFSSSINDLHTDPLGNVWVATNNSGLALLSCLREAIQRIDLGTAGGVFVIKSLPNRHHGVQVGGENFWGEFSWDELGPRVQASLPQGLPETIVWDGLSDDSGTWLATQAGLYHAPPGGSFLPALSDDPVLGAPSRVLMPRGSALWVGSLLGLACVEHGQVRAVNAPDGLLGYIYALTLDEDQALWIGTLGRGLWRELDGLQAIHHAPLRPEGNTYAVAQGPSGQMIVVQDDKVILLERDFKARLVAELPPVAGWTVAWLDAATVLLGASDGLRRVDLPSGRVTLHVRALLRPQDWEFTNNRTLLPDHEGRFLCGLSGGLARIDLQQLDHFAPPLCQLSRIDWEGAEPMQFGDRWTVRPGNWSVRIQAFSAWFADTNAVRFQFKLVGFSPHWTALQDRPDISFTSLPPGHYQLLCRAHTALTGVGPIAELLRLQVRTPWWTRGWAPALAAVMSQYDNLVRAPGRNRELQVINLALENAVAQRTQLLEIANRELQAMRDAFQQQAELDELTQVGNRRFFDKELKRAIAVAKRREVPVALLMIDIDHFKAVNDQLGHPTGDDYLRRVGRALADAVRQGDDVVARFGGEEFAMLLMNATRVTAAQSAERVRAAVERLTLPNPGSAHGTLTVSIGLALWQGDHLSSPPDLLLRADQALYCAKVAGRNRVEWAE